MSTQSHLILMRRDDRIKLSDDEIAELNDCRMRTLMDAEERRQRIRESSSDKAYRGICARTQNEASVKMSQARFHYLDEYHYVDRTDNSVWVVVSNQWFCSSFSALIDEFKVDYEGEKSQYFIESDEAEEISSACKYILNGNYDPKFEEIIGERWIRILEDVLPSYGSRFRNQREEKGLCLFIEKSDGDGWKVTDSKYEWGGEDSDESEISGRNTLENLLDIMNDYKREYYNMTDYNGNKKCDVKLMFYVS